jgi:hypothetical protein
MDPPPPFCLTGYASWFQNAYAIQSLLPRACRRAQWKEEQARPGLGPLGCSSVLSLGDHCAPDQGLWQSHLGRGWPAGCHWRPRRARVVALDAPRPVTRRQPTGNWRWSDGSLGRAHQLSAIQHFHVVRLHVSRGCTPSQRSRQGAWWLTTDGKRVGVEGGGGGRCEGE